MIRPAVEAALEVARLGLEARPPQPPPQGLQRYLDFSKLSPPALRAIAKVVDGDDAFRARVAAAVDRREVGEAGWLWLNRPDGWSEAVDGVEQEARARAQAAAEERSERSARRKLAAAREAAERATAAAGAHQQEADRLRAELAEERTRRAAAEERSEELSTELARIRGERARAVRELKETEAKLAGRAAEAKEAKARLRDLEAARPPGPASGPEPADRDLPAGDLPDRVLLTEALRAASAGAGALADALDRVGELVEPRPGDGRAGEVPTDDGRAGDGPAGDGPAGEVPADDAPAGGSADVDPGAGDGAPARPSAGAGPIGSPPDRTPLELPGGLLDDSVEAAGHLLRAPNVLALVDGYNVTMAGWPELPPAGQRARLVNGLDRVAARSGAEVEVVFDGADVEPGAPSQPGPRDVRVRFSPPGVEADDVLLDLLALIPPARPVVLVSSDNRVRDGARRHGANVVHARQLLELLRP